MSPSSSDPLDAFRRRFGREGQRFSAPGRVNLIGEHTDYNDGFVMPAAIDFHTTVIAAPRDDRRLVIHAEHFDETVERSLDPLRPGGPPHWSNYVAGVAWVLEQDGERLCGADMWIRGNVPLGAGLSSSASIEVAVGLALVTLGRRSEAPVRAPEGSSGDGEESQALRARAGVDRVRLALQCQRAENDFVGMRCGVMDQFISCNGRAGHALMLDCRSLDFTLLPVPAGTSIVICNTMVRHELTGGEYNERRADCEEGVRLLAARVEGVRALRDVSMDVLEAHASMLPPRIYRRCRHVVSENARVQDAARLLQARDLQGFGTCMAASHVSLRDDYEVSCAELDAMVDLAQTIDGVYGARMTGGGFGGCTVNLVDEAATSRFESAVSAGYHERTGIRPEIYICHASDGARNA